MPVSKDICMPADGAATARHSERPIRHIPFQGSLLNLRSNRACDKEGIFQYGRKIDADGRLRVKLDRFAMSAAVSGLSSTPDVLLRLPRTVRNGPMLSKNDFAPPDAKD